MPWISATDKARSLVLLDIDADSHDKVFRFDFDVVFNSIPVRRGTVQKRDYYIGTTGGEILAELPGAAISKLTEGQAIRVKHEDSITMTRNSRLTLSPYVRAKDATSEMEAGIGSVHFEVGHKRTFATVFSCEERELETIRMGDVVKWVVNLHRGEKAIRDFLLGNLHLFVECSWNGSVREGKIVVRPSDIRFFDSERRPLGSKHSIAMLYCLWARGINIRNREGCETLFRVNV